VAYQISISIAKKDTKLIFTGDGSQTAIGHLQAIEDLCSLLKLADIPHDDVKGSYYIYIFMVMLAYGLDL
jgi:hypothetical protein